MSSLHFLLTVWFCIYTWNFNILCFCIQILKTINEWRKSKRRFVYSPSTHTTLFWHPCDVVLTLWTLLYGHRNDVVCLRGCNTRQQFYWILLWRQIRYNLNDLKYSLSVLTNTFYHSQQELKTSILLVIAWLITLQCKIPVTAGPINPKLPTNLKSARLLILNAFFVVVDEIVNC